jgi:hypothetical protein
MSLLDDARKQITREVSDLHGDDDFMPFMLFDGPKARVYMALDMPEFGKPRDAIAEVMMASLAMHRATEAVFGTMAWTLLGITPEERAEWGNRNFEEHPARAETVFVIHAGADGGQQFHSAPVIRENGAVTLGEWVTGENERMSGRFAHAMYSGMALGHTLPPEMVEMIDAAIEAGEEREVMEPMIRAFRRVRAGDITPEEMAEARRLAGQLRPR